MAFLAFVFAFPNTVFAGNRLQYLINGLPEMRENCSKERSPLPSLPKFSSLEMALISVYDREKILDDPKKLAALSPYYADDVRSAERSIVSKLQSYLNQIKSYSKMHTAELRYEQIQGELGTDCVGVNLNLVIDPNAEPKVGKVPNGGFSAKDYKKNSQIWWHSCQREEAAQPELTAFTYELIRLQNCAYLQGDKKLQTSVVTLLESSSQLMKELECTVDSSGNPRDTATDIVSTLAWYKEKQNKVANLKNEMESLPFSAKANKGSCGFVIGRYENSIQDAIDEENQLLKHYTTVGTPAPVKPTRPSQGAS